MRNDSTVDVRRSRPKHYHSFAHRSVRCRNGLLVPGKLTGRPILVIDDDEFARDTLAQILELAGFRALQAANFPQALTELWQQPRPGLIVLDLVMPLVTGWEFCEHLRQNENLAEVPVLLLSAVDPTPLRARYDSIVEQFEKPVTVRELLAAIRRHCLR